MKILIASDLHGSAYYTGKLIEAANAERADKLVLLGDIYNHGPRNPLPEGYDPMAVAGMLNAVKDDLFVIKGNCDSDVDTLISEFDFIEEMCITIGDKCVLCTHGHKHNKDDEPKTKYDAVVYGHFHTGFVERKGATVYANTGSVSLPKDGTERSYITIDDEGKLTLKSLDGDVLATETI